MEAGETAEGIWLRAEQQSSGIGRLGRTWESPKGNLYCSTVVSIGHGDPVASSLSFVTSLAVYDTIRTCLPDADLALKWPNDVLLGGSKTCGILLEQVKHFVVVGVGMNVAVSPRVEGRTVTSLHQAGANSQLSAVEVLDLLSRKFVEQLAQWREHGLAAILQEWQKFAHPIGSKLSASVDKVNRVHGEYAGLTPFGALLLKKPDGSLVEIHAGDVEPA